MNTAPKKKYSPGMMINRALLKFGLVLFHAKKGFHYVPNIYGRSSAKLHDIRDYALFREAAERALKDGRTNHYYDRLYHLFQGAENAARVFGGENRVRVVEAGAWKGGSSFFLAYVFDKLLSGHVSLTCIDTFEGHKKEDLPPDGLEGLRHVPGLFGDTGFDDVKKYLAPYR